MNFAFFILVIPRLWILCANVRNTLFHLHGQVSMKNDRYSYLPANEDGTDSVFWNVGI